MVALRVSPNAAQHRWPRSSDGQIAAADLNRVTTVVDNLGVHPGDRRGGGARLGCGHPRQRSDHVRAGFGLPPSVDNRAGTPADVVVVPHPRFGIDGLADGAQDPQTRKVTPFGPVVSPLHKRANGCWCGVELSHPVALHDVPKPILVPAGPVAAALVGPRRVWRALVHDRSASVGQRPVDDVGVTGHPADIRGAPIHIGFGFQVKHVFVGERHLRQIAAGRVHDALGFGCGTRGVEQIEQLFGTHRLWRTTRFRGRHQVMPPMIATFNHDRVSAAAINHDDVLNTGRTCRERSIDVGLQSRRLTAPIAGVCSDDETSLSVFATVGDGVRRETAENN